mgnify:CR=1 FL=1
MNLYIHQSDHTMTLVKSIIKKFENVYVIAMCNKNVKLRTKISKWVKSKKIKKGGYVGTGPTTKNTETNGFRIRGPSWA